MTKKDVVSHKYYTCSVADSKIMVIDTYLAYGSYFYNHSLFLKLNIIIYILITRQMSFFDTVHVKSQ